MAVTAYATGTQTATVTTEHFVSSPNVAGTYTFHVDLSNMAAGDRVELRVYQMPLTGGSATVADYAVFDGAQPEVDVAVMDPIGNDLTDTNSLRFSIKQTHGTSRDFRWKVLSY